MTRVGLWDQYTSRWAIVGDISSQRVGEVLQMVLLQNMSPFYIHFATVYFDSNVATNKIVAKSEAISATIKYGSLIKLPLC
jgi:hypothetical protein